MAIPLRSWRFAGVVFAVCAGAVRGQDATPDTRRAAPDAMTYLDAALDLMQRHSLRRGVVDWATLRSAARAKAADASSPKDTHAAIRFALRELGDGHSFLITLYDGLGDQSKWEITPAESQAERLAGGIGYVRLPGFAGQTPDVTTAFAEDLQRRIAAVDAAEVVGWIVDLRACEGGNMWPMLAGLGPVLGQGTVGAFVPPEGKASTWGYRDGAAGTNGRPNVSVSEPYELRRPSAPVAILTSAKTASSGEAIVVAFRGRPATRSFGAPTAGVSTANDMMRLSDGSMLFLTVATYADRDGRLYGESIVPDEVIASAADQASADGAADPTRDAAIAWLRQQADAPTATPAPAALELIGRWKVDLRPTPDAEPYYQEFVVDFARSGEIRGTFYGSTIRSARLNRDWGELRFAFVTEDGSGVYHTSGVLRGDRMGGTTHSLGREFLSVWSAERRP